MNIWVFILPALISLFWIFKIFLTPDVCKVQFLMLGGMLALVLTMFLPETNAMFIYPFFYLAIRQKISPVGLLKWDYLIFIPSIALIPLDSDIAQCVLLSIQTVVVTIWGMVKLRLYNKKVAELYDSSSSISADNISSAIMFSSFSVILGAILYLLPPQISSSLSIMTLFSIFLAILQFYAGYNTFQMKDDGNVAAEVEDMEETAQSQETESVNQSPTVVMDQTIQRIIDDELYLDPTLSLVSLAEILHTNRTYLSRSIHDESGKNFSDFINTLRINHFLDIVRKEGRNVNIKNAAISSGYTNMQSFYRNFSELMDMTPKSWISKNIHD